MLFGLLVLVVKSFPEADNNVVIVGRGSVNLGAGILAFPCAGANLAVETFSFRCVFLGLGVEVEIIRIRIIMVILASKRAPDFPRFFLAKHVKVMCNPNMRERTTGYFAKEIISHKIIVRGTKPPTLQ